MPANPKPTVKQKAPYPNDQPQIERAPALLPMLYGYSLPHLQCDIQ